MDDFINKKINGVKYITRLMYYNIINEAIELNQTKENVDNFLQNNNIKVNNSILLMAQEKVKFYFTFFFAIRGDESRTFSTSNVY